MKRFLSFSTAFFVLLLGFGLQAIAVERSCAHRTLYQLIGSNRAFDPLPYAKSKSVLFLSDGTRTVDFSLGERLHRAYPDKKIVSADFKIQETVIDQNFTRMHMDNTRDFPFTDNSFDTITLRRGLCVCHDDRCCGGFEPVGKDARHFFKEVVRVLNKNNPNAEALLHGTDNVSPETQATWKKYLRQIEKKSNVRATFHYERDAFLLIRIQPTPAAAPAALTPDVFHSLDF